MPHSNYNNQAPTLQMSLSTATTSAEKSNWHQLGAYLFGLEHNLCKMSDRNYIEKMTFGQLVKNVLFKLVNKVAVDCYGLNGPLSPLCEGLA